MYIYIFYLSFLSELFTIHMTVGEEGGYFFHSSFPLPPVLQAFRHSWAITAESPPLT